MSRWNDGGWYTPAPKRPPPARGIKIKKAGTTWWGLRWIEALERMSRGYSNRLARGRTYARAGRTHDLSVKAGEVTAKVTGSRATPYTVRIIVAKLPAAVWTKAIAAMAGKAQFTAELLAGQMPHDIDAAFEEAASSIFPAKEADLQTSCSCPDWANPCKHVAATHYVLGEALDRDPFLLFELRGRTKAEVLHALRAARAAAGDVEAATRVRHGKKTAGDDNEVPCVSLGEVVSADYDTPRAPMPETHLRCEAPPVSGALLAQLGTPAAWSTDTSPAEVFAPIVRAAAQEARRLAMAEPETAEHPAARDHEPVNVQARAQSAAARSKQTTASRKAGKPAPRSAKWREKRPPLCSVRLRKS